MLSLVMSTYQGWSHFVPQFQAELKGLRQQDLCSEGHEKRALVSVPGYKPVLVFTGKSLQNRSHLWP